jgi:hypothetical protein
MKAVLMFVALSGFGIAGPSQRMHQARACVSRQSFWLGWTGGNRSVLAPSSFFSFQS